MANHVDFERNHDFSSDDIIRYSRQLIANDFDVDAQLRLKNAGILIVGCGGLGNPVGLYLACSGIGRIGLVDSDSIELSNLHRQIAFTNDKIGQRKVDVLRDALIARNPDLKVDVHNVRLTASNAMDVIRGYDVVADCSDNIPTRYILNDACFLLKKPLAMGSAVGWSGQFSFYHTPESTACYRCIYPKPNGTLVSMSCNDGGIFGPVVGMVGSIQAMEIIKFVGIGISSYSSSIFNVDLFSARTLNAVIRKKVRDCPTCSRVCEDGGGGDIDEYASICQSYAVDMLSEGERITVTGLNELLLADSGTLLVDVRPGNEYKIGHIRGSISIPIKDIIVPLTARKRFEHVLEGRNKCYFICRRGNDSQRAVVLARKLFPSIAATDVIGGYEAWRAQVDPTLPDYS